MAYESPFQSFASFSANVWEAGGRWFGASGRRGEPTAVIRDRGAPPARSAGQSLMTASGFIARRFPTLRNDAKLKHD